MHRLLARLIADQLAGLPAPAAEADDGPVSCPFGRHDMERLGATVWTCESDGVTLIARASGPSANAEPRMTLAEVHPQPLTAAPGR
ncbi:hypothetical protein ADL22_09755 [Streptomyces sp. NRRL F-4489]|nr:hypothetical protein ADL22_09755 [Streptomyces sp. NRRL F-4489]